jgi:hypothetical protein
MSRLVMEDHRRFVDEKVITPHLLALARSMGGLLASTILEQPYDDYREELANFVGPHECAIPNSPEGDIYDVPYFVVQPAVFDQLKRGDVPAEAPQLIPQFPLVRPYPE